MISNAMDGSEDDVIFEESDDDASLGNEEEEEEMGSIRNDEEARSCQRVHRMSVMFPVLMVRRNQKLWRRRTSNALLSAMMIRCLSVSSAHAALLVPEVWMTRNRST